MTSDSPRKYLSRLEQEVLTVLGTNRLYGLQIMDKINIAREIFEIPPMGVGSLYPALGRMVESGLLEVDRSYRRPYYQASTLGIDSLKGMVEYQSILAAWGDRSDSSGSQTSVDKLQP